jgi:hypothetical protein
MEMSGQLHIRAALFPAKEPRYLLEMGLGGPQAQYERWGEEKNVLPFSGIESRFLGRQAHNVVKYTIIS